MGKMNMTNDTLLSLFAEMALDEAIRKFKEQSLYREIDKALAEGNEQSFITLTTELRTLQSQG